MKRNGIEYPEPPMQSKRKDQYEASGKCIINIVIIFAVLIFGTYLWNKFGADIQKFFY